MNKDREKAFEIARLDMENIGISDEEILAELDGMTDEEVREFLEIE